VIHIGYKSNVKYSPLIVKKGILLLLTIVLSSSLVNAQLFRAKSQKNTLKNNTIKDTIGKAKDSLLNASDSTKI